MKSFEFVPFEGTEGKVTVYLHESPMDKKINYPVMVVCPGGGYGYCSPRESDPVAFEYFSKGYNVFILNYSVGENAKNFTPLKELSSTVMCIRKNAQEWNCIQDKIAVCGFSAGGHLVASIATLWNNPKFLEEFDNENGLNKPNTVILSYPVIVAGEFAHQGSIDRVSGNNEDLHEFFSLEKQVNKDTCPCFIWHTVADPVVPVENTLMFVTELQKNKIPFECHIFPKGNHGISVCTNEVGTLDAHNRQWVDLSINYLNKFFAYKF